LATRAIADIARSGEAIYSVANVAIADIRVNGLLFASGASRS
jgi:hypothetical protein